MKPALKVLGFTALLSTTLLGQTMTAHAENTAVETSLESYGDLSMFYQGLINTGVINELREDQHYTIFAPTNAAVRDIRPNEYPCFYSLECRPQAAAILRNHIIVGQYGLKDLTSYGHGVQTVGVKVAKVEEPFVGDYTVDGRKILSESDIDGNVIYRIDGVLAGPKTMAQFQKVSYSPSEFSPDTETVTTISTPVDGAPKDLTQTTVVVHRTTVQP